MALAHLSGSMLPHPFNWLTALYDGVQSLLSSIIQVAGCQADLGAFVGGQKAEVQASTYSSKQEHSCCRRPSLPAKCDES